MGNDKISKATSLDLYENKTYGAEGSITGGIKPEPPVDQLHRGMKSRHVQMISMGAVIGLGLFLGTANVLREAGPVGLLLGYSVMGTRGHVTLAKRFVNPSLSFALGWNYWYEWSLVLAAEISASAILIGYWTTSVSNAVWISIVLLVVLAINFTPTNFYGEFEFWFCSIKVFTIVFLIILGIVIDLGGGPTKDLIGFRYWRNPGPFVQFLGISGVAGRFLGFWASLIQATFSCIGTEITATAAGEAKNPKKTLPSAIRNVVFRICLFYIFGTFVVGLIVSSSDSRLNLTTNTAASSPFVIAIENAGIKSLPSLVNAALLSAACSAASSDMYTSSRAMYALAIAGNAPAIMKKTNSWGVPWPSVLLSAGMGCLSYMSLGGHSAGQVFSWLSTMASVAGLQTWLGILITYLRWDAGVKAQRIDRSEFPYKSFLRSKAAWYGLIFCFLILLFNPFTTFIPGHWDTPTFIIGYLPTVVFSLLYFGSYIYYARIGIDARPLKPDDMDFVTDVREDDRDPYESPDETKVDGVWGKLKSVNISTAAFKPSLLDFTHQGIEDQKTD